MGLCAITVAKSVVSVRFTKLAKTCAALLRCSNGKRSRQETKPAANPGCAAAAAATRAPLLSSGSISASPMIKWHEVSRLLVSRCDTNQN